MEGASRKVCIVKIDHSPTYHSWFVKFVERKKFQRHLAAQFDGRKFSLEYVIEWCNSNGYTVVT
jgi:hypothetical protein